MNERYEVQKLTPDYHKIFTGVYKDFVLTKWVG